MRAADPADTTLSYQFSDAFGGTAPADPAPWLTATFTQLTSHEVQVSLTTHLSGSEDVKLVDLNLAYALSNANPTLSFTPVSGATAASASHSEDTYKADGDGYYDINLAFGGGSSGLAGTSTHDIQDLSTDPTLSTAVRCIRSIGSELIDWFSASATAPRRRIHRPPSSG